MKLLYLFQIILTFGSIDNKSALLQVWTWCQTGDNPLSKPMDLWFYMLSLGHNELTDIKEFTSFVLW